MCSICAASTPAGAIFHGYAARAEGFRLKTVVRQFFGNVAEDGLLRRSQFDDQRHEQRWLSTCCAERCRRIRSNSTRSWATC
jgi:hypothetical protein